MKFYTDRDNLIYFIYNNDKLFRIEKEIYVSHFRKESLYQISFDKFLKENPTIIYLLNCEIGAIFVNDVFLTHMVDLKKKINFLIKYKKLKTS